MAELADFNVNIKYRPGISNTDADILSRLPLDPSEYMEDCTAETEKNAICATIQTVIHQGEDVIPWVTAASASVGIVYAEPVVTDLVYKHEARDTLRIVCCLDEHHAYPSTWRSI